jgi:hypothetical protein
VVRGPAARPLNVYEVQVADGSIRIGPRPRGGPARGRPARCPARGGSRCRA